MNRDSFGEKAREAFTVQYSGGPHLVFAENIRPEADYALPQTPFGAMKGAPSLCSPPPPHTPLFWAPLDLPLYKISYQEFFEFFE